MKIILFFLGLLSTISVYSQPVTATFEVDLSLYQGTYSTVEFYRAGSSYLMTSSGGNIYTYTATVPPGPAQSNYTYKFKVDGVTETFNGTELCVGIIASDTLRIINLNTTTPAIVCWESCNTCATAIPGCTDSTAINYNPLANLNNDSCAYNVTFYVDMSESNQVFDTVEVNGTFNSWCGNCAQMTDANNDEIWEVTIPLISGIYDYKFSADNWNVEENLYEFDDCVVGNPPYINRSLIVTGNHLLDTVCWNRCYSCDTERNFYKVTFQVDMTNITNPFTLPEVNGTFNNWCGSCWSLDNQGNNIFSKSFNVDTSLHTFKYSSDNWTIEEDLDSNLSCILINYDPTSSNGWGYVNRYLYFNEDTILEPICWEDCSVCAATGPSWNCDGQGNCFDPGNGLGFYNDSLSCIVDCQATNVIDNKNGNYIIYPNPTKESIFIQNPENVEMIIIYNKLGERIFRIDCPQNITEINLLNQAADIYFIEFHNGKHITRKKIVKI